MDKRINYRKRQNLSDMGGRTMVSDGKPVHCGWCGKYEIHLEQAREDLAWNHFDERYWDALEGHRCLTDAQKAAKMARDEEARYLAQLEQPTPAPAPTPTPALPPLRRAEVTTGG